MNQTPITLTHPLLLIGRERGLPSMQVHDVALDSNNVLWAAGPNGLAKVDDQRIRCIGRRDGLRSHGLRCVAAGADGRVWVGGDGGIDVVHANGILEDNAEPWSYGVVEKICVLDENVLAATSSGIRMWRPETGWDGNQPKLNGTYVNQLASTSTGTIWAAGPQIGIQIGTQIGTQIGGARAWNAPNDDQWRRLGAISAIAPTASGTVFIGGSNGAAEYSQGGDFIRPVWFGANTEANLSALWCFGSELWAGVDGQLRVGSLTSTGWRIDHTVSDKLLVKAMIGDVHGTIWCATDSDGLAKVTPARKAITRPMLPELAAALCIKVDPPRLTDDAHTERYLVGGNGGAWEITAAAGFSRETEPLFPNLKVWDLLRRADGTIWAATQSGLHIRNAEGLVRHVGGDHAIVASPNRFLHEHGGAVVLGTINGVVSIDGHQEDWSFIQPWGDSKGQSIGYAYCVMEWDGSVFVGTLGRGLWRKDEDHFVQIVAEGLIATGNTPAVVRGDGFFIVSQDDRLVRLNDDGTSQVLATSDEAVMGWALAFDSRNRLWVGSPSGLKSYDVESGELLRTILVWMGLGGWEFTTSRSLVAGERGMLLCGLNSGLALVDSDALETLSTPLVAQLDAVRWFAARPNVCTENCGGIDVPLHSVDHGPWTVELDVHARTLVDDGTTSFRFLLEGFDVDWSLPSAFASTRFSSLPVGTYRLKVQAHSPLSGWGEASVALVIEVRPSMWRESDDPRHLVALLEDRVRISRDLHDNVVQRLFATGMELDALTRRMQTEEANGIQRVIEQLDETIAEVRRAVFSLGSNESARQGSLHQSVVEIARRAEELGGLTVDATIDPDIDTKLPLRIGEELLSVIREAMSNVVRHAHATHAYLSVSLTPNADQLEIALSDDGRGIGKHPSTGNGLRNLRSRAVAVGGSLDVASSSETGTRLTWTVPLPKI